MDCKYTKSRQVSIFELTLVKFIGTGVQGDGGNNQACC